ncbi:MAG TPA: phage holin family protein [Xanthomonadaceae bacterium]|nr:phage holin family protein [Xanthomonadaceae bacterium]
MSDPERPPADAPPGLEDAAGQIGEVAGSTVAAALAVLSSFRRLVAADIAQSRAAFGRALAYTGLAVAIGTSACLLLVTLLVVLLSNLGLSWVAALALIMVAAALPAAWFTWRAVDAYGHTQLDATRRQLARLGLGEDPDGIEREPEHMP